ncbi:MAG: hypothetical protein EA352_05025 [Gemmatimonadales bacterium]|nr:MAG: hypothetical protein EA352_05025 [Gemmatimonadales bacterium]
MLREALDGSPNAPDPSEARDSRSDPLDAPPRTRTEEVRAAGPGVGDGSEDGAAPAAQPTAVPMWEVASEPDLVLGKVDGPQEQLFQVIGGVAQMSGGSLAVVDSGRSQIFFFSESGEYLRTAGRYGEGPGELQAHRLLQARQYDRLVLASRLRISEAHEDGRIEPLLHGGLYGVRDWFRAVTPDGLVVQRLQNMGERMQRSGPRTEDDLVLRYDLSLSDWVELGRFRYEHRYIELLPQAAQRSFGLPLHAELSLAPTEQGVLVSVGNGNEMLHLGPDGSAKDTVRLPIEPRSVGRAEVEDWVEARLARHEHRGADAVSEIRDTYLGMPRPDEMPVVESLIPDPEGTVWVELASDAPEFPGAQWLALDEDWEVVGWLRLPEGFELSQVGSDFVLGTAFGPHGIGLVQRFQLRRLPAAD